MARYSKKRQRESGKNSGLRKKSRTMKNSKRGESLKKMKLEKKGQKKMTVFCVSCGRKVVVSDYTIKEMKTGACQLIGICPRADHKLDKNGERKVYSFVSRDSL